MLSERAVTTLSWIATAASVTMYVSYVAQIRLTLSGEKGSMIQPLANAPGIVPGALSLATAF